MSAAASALAGKTQRNRRVIAVLASGGASFFFQVKNSHIFPCAVKFGACVCVCTVVHGISTEMGKPVVISSSGPCMR